MIDWNDDCIFEGNQVVKFKTQKPSNSFSMKPIPQTEKVKHAVLQAYEIYKQISRRPTRDEIAIIWKKLSLHFGGQQRTASEINSLISDYYIDLKSYPVKLIEEACQQYRTMSEGNKYMPGTGCLIALIKRKASNLEFIKSRIDKLLKTNNLI